jgi:hypothetical protein
MEKTKFFMAPSQLMLPVRTEREWCVAAAYRVLPEMWKHLGLVRKTTAELDVSHIDIIHWIER